jgi:Tfp pilus assembly protein PilP
MKISRQILLLGVYPFILTACHKASPSQAVQHFVAQLQQAQYSTEPAVRPYYAPYTPIVYQTAPRDPFFWPRLRHVTATNPLRDYSLSQLVFVGIIEQDGQVWGLIQDHKDTIYIVKKGDEIGENAGTITAITQQALSVDERVQEHGGPWLKHSTAIKLSQ